MGNLEFRLKTLTPIWTGGVTTKATTNDFLHETGLIGAIRWWYEALVRGLNGYACDPHVDGCKFNTEGYEKAKREGESLEECLKIGLQDVCAVCRFFGCTEWSKKFRFSITDKDGIRSTPLNSKDVEFSMIFKKIKNFDDEERWLLIKTFEIITKYGSIGGKTVFKPSENPNKNYRFHHQDFGLLEKVEFPTFLSIEKEKIKEYIKRDGQDNQVDWPNLSNFWFVNNCSIERETLNEIVSRNKQGRYGNPSELLKCCSKILMKP